MRLATIAFATMMLLGPAPWLATAAAQGVLSPDDACIGVIHSPAEPVGSAPSKAIVGIALSPDYAGGDFVFHLTGASGDQTGTGTVGPDGLAFAEAPLFQYGVHQITDATVTTADGPMAVDVASIGDGGSFVVDDAEPLCDSTVLTAVPPTTTTTTTEVPTETTSTTTTTEVPTETTSTTTTTEVPTETTSTTTTTEQTDEGGGISWPGILIGGGLIGVLGGALLALTGKKNCDREREALASAQRQLSAISETLEGAVDDFEDQESEISDLEAELESYNQAKQRGSSVDGDVRYYAHGGDRIPESELAIQVEYYEAMLENAREARAQDEARITEWQAKFDKAEQKVREAEEALAECEGAGTTDAAPPPSQPTGPGTPGPSGPRGPAISIPPLATDPSQPACEDGATYTETGEPETLRVIVDFAVIVTVVEGSERRVGEAAVMTLGLAELAADLDVIGSALGAKGAGQSIAGGIGGMASGTYVMGAGGLARGAAEGAMASGLTDVSIPTSPPEAVVEVLEGVANLGALVSKKVGEWLVANQLYEVRLTLFQQTITATPYDLSTCIGGEWECRRVWQYDVGPLTKRGRSNSKTFRLASDIARHRMQSEISRMGRRAQSAIAASVEARSDFDTRHQPGSCE